MDKILDVFELYADSDDSKINKFQEKLNSNMKVRIEKNSPRADVIWIDMMENTIQYLDNILRAPTRLIINEEEVVKIEKIKKVTVDSIKHLSKNAGFIEDIDEKGDVRPGKLLNVYKEETFNTYENRFIYTLIIKMLTIIRKQKTKMLKNIKSSSKEYKKIDYSGNSYTGKDKVDIQMVLTATTESEERKDNIRQQLERIKALEKNVINLTLTSTYQILEKLNVPMITPPLKKNNVILKNVNFQYATKLWDFLINEMEKTNKGDNELKVKDYTDTGKSKRFVDETFLLNYIIMQCVENPEITGTHKKEIIEQLVANMVQKTIDVNDQLTEDQLKNIVSKQYKVIKYRGTTSNKEIQAIFRKYITKYVQKISK